MLWLLISPHVLAHGRRRLKPMAADDDTGWIDSYGSMLLRSIGISMGCLTILSHYSAAGRIKISTELVEV